MKKKELNKQRKQRRRDTAAQERKELTPLFSLINRMKEELHSILSWGSVCVFIIKIETLSLS